MTDKLTQLKKMTVVVADTGDINSIQQYAPEDATTNPSLIYKAAMMPEYKSLVERAISWGKDQGGNDEIQLENTLDFLAVSFGKEILNLIPGRISTEVDARLSFDGEQTLQRARKLIQLYKAEGVQKDKVLIKVASTWEGIKAAELLEKEGINCNLTLLFGRSQAIACAQSNVFLISPFVGRILDWYKKNTNESFSAENDPGVLSVKWIYNYYKKYGYRTVVMGASFRNTGEIEALAGCDRLTIGPNFLEELSAAKDALSRSLNPEDAKSFEDPQIDLDEKTFRWMLNEDAMATEKLAEGIRGFSADLVKLEEFVKQF